MVEKRRCSEEEEGLATVQENKRRQLTLEAIVRGLLEKEFLPTFETLIRRVVRDEFERVIAPFVHSFPRSSLDRINASEPRGWQLHFRNKLPNTLFTGNPIETEDGEPLQIVIIDSISKRIVTTGPVSSIKVEILVLDGDFGSDSKEDWSEEDFNACVIRERDGKRPLVTGDLQITVKDGVGYIGEITFTDNSSWTRSRTFRLGAKVVSRSCEVEGIREARSEAFVVKDHRGVLYKKHYPPSLGDEVWRLDKIGKEGAFHNRLVTSGIKEVKDLLRLLVTDPPRLRSILGNGSAVPSKTWETITKHAQSCILDNKSHMYYIAGRQIRLIFDSVYSLLGAIFDEQSYKPLGNLTESEKFLVESLKQQAYRNINDIVEIDWPLVNDTTMALPLEGSSFSDSSLDSPHPQFPAARPGQPAIRGGHNNPNNSHTYAVEDYPGQLGEFSMQGICQAQCLSSIKRNSFKMKEFLASYASDHWDPGESSGSIFMGGYLPEDADDQVQLSEWCSSWGQGSGFIMASGDDTGIGFMSTFPDTSIHMARSRRPNMGWFKIWAAVKWMISVRRAMAARRRERIRWHPSY